jgi:hypothetical protein
MKILPQPWSVGIEAISRVGMIRLAVCLRIRVAMLVTLLTAAFGHSVFNA